MQQLKIRNHPIVLWNVFVCEKIVKTLLSYKFVHAGPDLLFTKRELIFSLQILH